MHDFLTKVDTFLHEFVQGAIDFIDKSIQKNPPLFFGAKIEIM